MKKAPTTTKTTAPASGLAASVMIVGKIARINESGQVLIDYPGNPSGPVIARLTASVQAALSGRCNPSGREVLLAFEHSDPARPIIVDAMYSVIDEIMDASDVAALDAGKPEEVVVDGKRVVLDAEEEIVLRCGKARITLTRLGKVLISGEYVVSSATGANKVKGGSIHLN